MATLRVIHLITKATGGGAQRYVADVARALHERGHDVAVWYGEPGTLAETLQRAGIPVRHFPSLRRAIGAHDLKALAHLTRAFKETQPHVVHLHSSKAGVIGALSARLAGVQRIIFTAHNWGFAHTSSLPIRTLYRALHLLGQGAAHHTIAVSHATAQAAPWKRRTTVLPNALDADSLRRSLKPYHRARTELSALIRMPLPMDEFVIGSVAELLPIKGIDVALHGLALANARGTLPPWRYVVMGEGPERDALANIAAREGIADRVVFAGYVPHAATLLPALDLFLLPSRSEGMPYALLEAGIAEVPILATRTGGIPEVVGPLASLVPPNNPHALATALGTIVSTPTPLRRARARLLAQHLAHTYTLAQHLYTLEQLYQTPVPTGVATTSERVRYTRSDG